MINFKKGTAYSLLQSDKVGLAKANEGVVAGMLVHIDATNLIVKGVTAQGVADNLGFAINNQTDGDVIESKKIGYIALDGNSVVETDQCSDGAGNPQTISAANFPIGTRLGGDLATGFVKVWASGDRVIGYVEGIRNLQAVQTVSQNYLDLTGATVSNTVKIQTTIPLLGIKLGV